MNKFGDLITADHVDAGKHGLSGYGENNAIVIADSYTKTIYGYPRTSHATSSVVSALQEFVSSGDKVGLFYTDGAGELEKAALKMEWRHDASPPYRPQSNGVAERAVRTVVEGTRALLCQSGMHHRWWPFAMRAFSTIRNFTVEVVAGRRNCATKQGATPADEQEVAEDEQGATPAAPKVGTPYFLKFGESFKGQTPVFGQMITYLMEPKRKGDEPHQKFISKIRKAIFLGHRVTPGGRWKGEYIVLDWPRTKSATMLQDAPIYKVKEIYTSEEKTVSLHYPRQRDQIPTNLRSNGRFRLVGGRRRGSTAKPRRRLCDRPRHGG